MQYILLFPLLILLLVLTGCTATHRVKTMSLSPTPLPTRVVPYVGPTSIVVKVTATPTPIPRYRKIVVVATLDPHATPIRRIATPTPIRDIATPTATPNNYVANAIATSEAIRKNRKLTPTPTPYVFNRPSPTPAPDLRSTPTPWPLAEFEGPTCSKLGQYLRLSESKKRTIWNDLVTSQDRAVIRSRRGGGAVDYKAIDQEVARAHGVSLDMLDCIDQEAFAEDWDLPPWPGGS